MPVHLPPLQLCVERAMLIMPPRLQATITHLIFSSATKCDARFAF